MFLNAYLIEKNFCVEDNLSVHWDLAYKFKAVKNFGDGSGKEPCDSDTLKVLLIKSR